MLPTFFTTVLLLLALSQVSSADRAEPRHRRSRIPRAHRARADGEVEVEAGEAHQLAARAAVAGWTYVGCVTDGGSGALTGYVVKDTANTNEKCISTCADLGFSYAGMGSSSYCKCGNTLSNGQGKAQAESVCNWTCAGDKSETCGQQYKLSLYKRNAAASSSSAPSTKPSSAAATSVRPSSTSTRVATTSAKPTTTSVKPSTTSVKPTTTTGAGCNAACTSLAGTSAPGGGGGIKALWAHHMVGNTYSYTPATWADDIDQAAYAGFDGFALNHGSDSWQPDRMDDAYAAADAKGRFKMFLSIDVTAIGCGSTSDAQTISSLILRYANHTSQAKHEGKTLVSTFAGDNCPFGQGSTAAGWTYVRSLVRKGGVEIYLIPAIFVDTNQFSSMTWFDGAFNWDSAWPVGAAGSAPLTTDSDWTWISRLGSRGYMASVSSLFFTYYGPQSWNKDWIYRSDDWLIARRFEQLASMRDHVDMAEFVTWNDYGESHYVGPIRADQPNSQGWVNGFPHTAWLSLIRYYSQGFRYGSYPKITSDQMWLWSRPHPKAATPSAPTNPRPANWDTTEDNLYVLVMLTFASRVVIISGGNTGTWWLQPGVNKLSIASSPGPISARIERNNVRIKAFDSTGQFSYTNTPVDYNYNYWVASA